MAQVTRERTAGTGDLSIFLAVLVLATGVTACDRAPDTSAPLDSSSLNSPTPDGPPPPPDGAFLAQMAPAQTSQLTSLGVEVVVPGQVPPAFSIVELRVDQGDSGPGYLVVYQNAANQCFAIEFASAGIEAPPPTANRLPLKPPLFGDRGYGLNYGPFTDPDMQAQFPQPNLFTDWMLGSAGAYRLIGATYIGDLFPPLRGCQDISPQEAIALAESLTVLSADPMGQTLEGTP